jgi:photosystem II stability/assembly factor-like uncharacterized protein
LFLEEHAMRTCLPAVKRSSLVTLTLSVALLSLFASASAQQGEKVTDREAARRLGISTEQLVQLRNLRAMTNEELLQLPADAVPVLLRRLTRPNLQMERVAFRRLQENNETGTIPLGAHARAMQRQEVMRARIPAQAIMAGLPIGPRVDPSALTLTDRQPGRLDPGEWEALGPANAGGRTRSILLHPRTPKIIWLGSVGGGVWKSEDSGETFGKLDDKMASLAVSCLAMDPTNPDIIFAGTGEGFPNADAIRGTGVFRTKDGGKTWLAMEKWSGIPKEELKFFYYVNRLAVSRDGKVVLAATRTGLYRHTTGESGWQLCEAEGRGSLLVNNGMLDVRCHPKDAKQCIAGGWFGIAFYSTNGGLKWRAASGLPVTPDDGWRRVELTYAAADPKIVYAALSYKQGELYYAEIYRSEDGGRSYTRRYQGAGKEHDDPLNYFGAQGWYNNVIWAGHPKDPDFLLVGGIDLWKSPDGGKSLQKISNWGTYARKRASLHSDQHAITAHPNFDGTNNKTVYVANDGGLFVTADIFTAGNDAEKKAGWLSLTNLYEVTQFYSVAVGPGDTIIGGTQDNGTFRYISRPGSRNWEQIRGGDGGHVAVDATENKYLYGETQWLDLFRSAGSDEPQRITGEFYRKSRNGKWETVLKEKPYLLEDAFPEEATKRPRANFIAPFVLDPNDPKKLLAGGLSLWRTNDARVKVTDTEGPEWAPIKAPTGKNTSTCAISAIAVAKGNSDIIWVGHNQKGEKGSLFRTANGKNDKPTWHRADDGRPALPNRPLLSVTIDPRDSKVVYVTFGGYPEKDSDGSNLWRTTNDGEKWEDIGADLPKAPVRSLAIHPENSDLLYVGTEVGIFASNDRGKKWDPTNQGPTNCSVEQLVWWGKVLYAATHGRGVFRINAALPKR